MRIKAVGKGFFVLGGVGVVWAAWLLVPLGVSWLIAMARAGWAGAVAWCVQSWIRGNELADAFLLYQRENPVEVGFRVLAVTLVLGGVGYLLTRERVVKEPEPVRPQPRPETSAS